ncbi:hypothetical protein HYQ46_009739 [Verticillium longisporum]|nr:hypothetical protein HYQ46_009739 [Verticillium longisporum]
MLTRWEGRGGGISGIRRDCRCSVLWIRILRLVLDFRLRSIILVPLSSHWGPLQAPKVHSVSSLPLQMPRSQSGSPPADTSLMAIMI